MGAVTDERTGQVMAPKHIDDTLAAAQRGEGPAELPDKAPRLAWDSWRYVVKRVVKEFYAERGIDVAAMMTFFTTLSLAPALLAVYSLFTLLVANNEELVSGFIDEFIDDVVPDGYEPPVRDFIETVIGSPAGGVVGLVIGLATALWSSSAYMRAFSRGSNAVYRRAEGRGMVRKWGMMLFTTLVFLFGVALVLVSLALNEPLVSGLLGPVAAPLGLSGALDFLLRVFLPVWVWLKWPFILGLMIGMIAILYYFAPNVRKPRFRWLTLGSAFAILGIAVVSAGLYIYFTFFGGYSSYGAVGGIIAVLFALWFYNIVLLVGVKIDAETERARELQSGIHAERDIQLPPRATARVERLRRIRDGLEAEGRQLRERHEQH